MLWAYSHFHGINLKQHQISATCVLWICPWPIYEGLYPTCIFNIFEVNDLQENKICKIHDVCPCACPHTLDFVIDKANIKIIFVSPYPTISKEKGWLVIFSIYFLKRENDQIPEYEKDIKTNWICLKCFEQNSLNFRYYSGLNISERNKSHLAKICERCS